MCVRARGDFVIVREQSKRAKQKIARQLTVKHIALEHDAY